MPLQIRRGNTAEIQAITPLVGEIIYNTQTQKLHVGNGTTAGGVITSSYSDNEAKDAAAASLAAGTHNRIAFSYNSTTKALNAVVSQVTSADVVHGNYNINVKADDTSLIINTATKTGIFETVNAASGMFILRDNDYDNLTSIFQITQFQSTAADAQNISIFRGRGTASAPLAVQSGDDICDLVFIGHNGTSGAAGASISATISGAVSTTSMPTRIAIATNNGSTLAERVAVEANGLLRARFGITNNTITIDGNRISTDVSNADIDIDPNGTGAVNFVGQSQLTVGAAGGAGPLPATPSLYFRIKINGIGYLMPVYTIV
jgi:hypothetical protein